MGRIKVRVSDVEIPYIYIFRDHEDLKKIFDSFILTSGPNNIDLSIEFESIKEICEICKLFQLNEYQDIQPTVMQVRVLRPQRGIEDKEKSEGKNSLMSGDRVIIDEEKVYEVVRTIVEERIRENRPYFMLRELYVPIFGRELKIYGNPVDHRLSHALERSVKRVLARLSRELGIQFKEDTIYTYGGKTGRFKVFRIIRNSVS